MTNSRSVGIDISVVMTVHREWKFYKRTMLSLEAAVAYAASFGLTLELIVVMDAPDEATLAFFGAYRASTFVGIRRLQVDHRDRGLSRNAGIEIAGGAYIALLDSNDLVSYNYIACLYDRALESPRRSLVFPEYIFGFGTRSFLRRLGERPEISLLGFLSNHPYSSRLLTHRATYDELKYEAVAAADGYAHEDWRFTAEAVGRGYECRVARNATHYERHPRDRACAGAIGSTEGQIAPARLFEPDVFTRLSAGDYHIYLNRDGPATSADAVKREFIENRVVVNTALAANRIDPAIDISRVPYIPCETVTDGALEFGAAYFEIAQGLVGEAFTDVALVPARSRRHGNELVADVLCRLESVDRDRNILVLVDEGDIDDDARAHFPKRTVFLDLFRRFPRLGVAQRDVLILKLLQTAGARATLHLTDCAFATRFFDRFGRLLRSHTKVLHHDRGYDADRGVRSDSKAAFFVSEQSDLLDIVVTTEEEHRLERLGVRTERILVITPSLPASAASSGEDMASMLLRAATRGCVGLSLRGDEAIYGGLAEPPPGDRV